MYTQATLNESQGHVYASIYNDDKEEVMNLGGSGSGGMGGTGRKEGRLKTM